MATKKRAVVEKSGFDPGDLRRVSDAPAVEFDERRYFIQNTATEILLAIASKRSNGAPVRGDELAAVTSATELANLLGIK